MTETHAKRGSVRVEAKARAGNRFVSATDFKCEVADGEGDWIPVRGITEFRFSLGVSRPGEAVFTLFPAEVRVSADRGNVLLREAGEE